MLLSKSSNELQNYGTASDDVKQQNDDDGKSSEAKSSNLSRNSSNISISQQPVTYYEVSNDEEQQEYDEGIAVRIDAISSLLNPVLQSHDSIMTTTAVLVTSELNLPVPTPIEIKSGAATDKATKSSNNMGLSSSGSSSSSSANIVFQCALRLGVASYKYGCVGYRIEAFLVKLLETYGYDCTIIVSNMELIASIFAYQYTRPRKVDKLATNDGTGDNEDHISLLLEEEHFLPITISIPLAYGEDLHRLGKVSDVCHDILYNQLHLSEAMLRLDAIEQLPPTWNIWTRFAAYVGTSLGFCATLGGNWNDVALSIIGSSTTFLVTQLFAAHCSYDTIRRIHSTWQNFFCAFLPALMASSISTLGWIGIINVNTVVISCIISELPGMGIKKGISELARNRILAGVAHVIGAIFTSFWLGLGGWVGVMFVKILSSSFFQNEIVDKTMNLSIDDIESSYNDANDNNTKISTLWFLLLFGPILCLSFPIFFKVGYDEMVPAFIVSALSLTLTGAVTYFNNTMFANFLAAFVTSLASHIWSRGWCSCFLRRQITNYDISIPYKPESIVGIPAFFALAGGSLGFRGSFGLLTGDSSSGELAFQQMLILTLILVLGVYVGETVLPSKAILNAW